MAIPSEDDITYDYIRQRALEDEAFKDGLQAAALVCKTQGAVGYPCPSDMAAVYITRLSQGENP
jgi:hypothetical protein